jgi:hypothetical protein
VQGTVDGRHPHQLDPPVVGEFRNGVGVFIAKRLLEREVDPGELHWVRHHSQFGSLLTGIFSATKKVSSEFGVVVQTCDSVMMLIRTE